MPAFVLPFARIVIAATCLGTVLCVMPAIAQPLPGDRPAQRRPAPRQSEASLAETADWLKRWLPQIGGMTYTTVTRGPRWDANSASMLSILSAELDRCVLTFDVEGTLKIDGAFVGVPYVSRTSVALDALDGNTVVLKNLTSAPPTLPTVEHSASWTVSVAARGASKPVRTMTAANAAAVLSEMTSWGDTLGVAVQDEPAGRRVKAALSRALTLCAPISRKEPF